MGRGKSTRRVRTEALEKLGQERRQYSPIKGAVNDIFFRQRRKIRTTKYHDEGRQCIHHGGTEEEVNVVKFAYERK